MAGGVGAGREVVLIEMMTAGEVHVINSFGARRVLPLRSSRGKGLLPKVGETWIIDNDIGQWMLGFCTVPDVPEITASVIGGTAEDQLLDQLDQLGVIIDSAPRVDPEVIVTLDWSRYMNVFP